jgi:hypothetical protein
MSNPLLTIASQLTIEIDTITGSVTMIAEYGEQGAEMLNGQATDCSITVNGQPYFRKIKEGTNEFLNFFNKCCLKHGVHIEQCASGILRQVRALGVKE